MNCTAEQIETKEPETALRNTWRTRIGRMLNAVGLRGVARKIEWTLKPLKFEAETHVTPPAVERVMKAAHESGLLDRGDYFEFGCYRGYTTWFAQKVVRDLGNQSMRFLGFDSFTGFPQVEGVDKYHGDFVVGQFAVGLEWVRAQMTESGTDWDRTFLVPGNFEDTLNDKLKRDKDLESAAVILVDCVLYESTVEALKFAEDMIIDGTIILFDDWNAFDCDPNRGERRAFREFLERNPQWEAHEEFAYGTYGQVFRLRERRES